MQLEPRGNRIRSIIVGNPLNKGYYTCNTGGGKGVLPFPLQMGVWNRLSEFPRVRAGQWEGRNRPSPWSLPLQQTPDSASHCPLHTANWLSPPCFSEYLCPTLLLWGGQNWSLDCCSESKLLLPMKLLIHRYRHYYPEVRYVTCRTTAAQMQSQPGSAWAH